MSSYYPNMHSKGIVRPEDMPLLMAWLDKLDIIDKSAPKDSEQYNLCQLYKVLLIAIAEGSFKFPSGPFVDYPPPCLLPLDQLPSAPYIKLVLRRYAYIRGQKKAFDAGTLDVANAECDDMLDVAEDRGNCNAVGGGIGVDGVNAADCPGNVSGRDVVDGVNAADCPANVSGTHGVDFPGNVSGRNVVDGVNAADCPANVSGRSAADCLDNNCGRSVAHCSPNVSVRSAADCPGNTSGRSVAHCSPNVSGRSAADCPGNTSGRSVAHCSPNVSGRNVVDGVNAADFPVNVSGRSGVDCIGNLNGRSAADFVGNIDGRSVAHCCGNVRGRNVVHCAGNVGGRDVVDGRNVAGWIDNAEGGRNAADFIGIAEGGRNMDGRNGADCNDKGEKSKAEEVCNPLLLRDSEVISEPGLRMRSPTNPLPEHSSDFNAYENPEEIAKVIARSQGQTVQEFVGAVGRYTRDSGQAIEAAMRADAANFRDYIENVSSQYLKDLTEVLDEQQNRELQEIRKDIEKWQTELSNVKKRIREMLPTFDIDLYKKDPNYIRKMFAFNNPTLAPEEDSFKRYKEESTDRLKAINEMLKNVTQCNNQAKEDLANINIALSQFQSEETEKQQSMMKCLCRDIEEYRKLRDERDKVTKEYNCLMSRLEEMGE